MAKYATKRKRSYKKRRTIRKLKTTLRRKIQRGGDPLLIKLFFIIFIALFSNSSLGKAFITILTILTGTPIENDDSSSSQINITQRGGGKLGDALNAFNTALQGVNDNSISSEDKTKINRCVTTLTSGQDTTLETTLQAASQSPPAVTETGLANAINDIETASNTSGGNNNIINAVKNKYSSLIDKVKPIIQNKLTVINDPQKKACMITLFDVGFRVMKAKLSQINISDVTRANAALVKEKASGHLSNFKGAVTDRYNTFASSENGQAAAAKLGDAKTAFTNRFNAFVSSDKGQAAAAKLGDAKGAVTDRFKSLTGRFGF